MKAKENHSALIFKQKSLQEFRWFWETFIFDSILQFFFQEMNDVEILRAKRNVESSSAKLGSYNIV